MGSPRCNTPCPPQQTPCSKCKELSKNNVWVERGSPGARGICLLDTMTLDQVAHVLMTLPGAAKDLLAITTDPQLIHLAKNVQLLPTGVETDLDQARINRPADSIPYYTLFRGNPPYAQ